MLQMIQPTNDPQGRTVKPPVLQRSEAEAWGPGAMVQMSAPKLMLKWHPCREVDTESGHVYGGVAFGR